MRTTVALGLVLVLLAAPGCAWFGWGGDAKDAGAPLPVAAADASEPPGAEKLDAVLDRARALERDGKRRDAEDVYRRGILRTDLTNVERAQLHLRLARLLAETGRAEDAGEHAREALRLRPGWDDAADFLTKLEGGGKGSKRKDGRDRETARRKGDGKDDGKDRKDARDDADADAKARRRAASGSADDLAGLRRELAGFREAAHRIEQERDLLRLRVAELEKELAAVREECSALRARTTETK